MQLKQQSEPCVRITVSIPKDAAQRLRQLAAEGSTALRSLGILGVQLEGDSVISLKVAGQDSNVNTTDNVAGGLETTASSHAGDTSRLDDLSQLLGNGASAGNSNAFYQQHLRVPSASNVVLQQQQQQQQQKQQEMLQQRRNILLGGPSTSSAAQQALLQRQQQGVSGYNTVGSTPQVFKSPNTICPMEGKVPLPPQVLNPTNGTVPSNARDFPFESMRQARVLQGRGQDVNASLNNSIVNGPSTSSGVGSIQPSLASSLTSPIHGKGTQVHQLGQAVQPQHLGRGVVAPPNVALKVVKNPQSGEILATIAAGANATLGVKSQFLQPQPPPPPYPGVSVGVNATHNNVSGSISSQQTVSKPIHQSHQYIPPSGPQGATVPSNNIAISSPLLVNLLQNDGNSSSVAGNQSNQQLKPHTPSHTLLHQQQPPLASMSPSAQQQQQHLVNSPMRDFLLQQQQPQQINTSADASNLGAIGVPSSPTTAGVGVNSNRNMQPQQQLTQTQGQQQILLSPNNLYNQQQPRFHQQQVTPQQVALLRHQQMQRQQQMQQQTAGASSPQRFVQQQQQIVSPVLNQMRQIRPGMSLQHQQHQSSHQQSYMSSGGMSPVAHSPASSHHSSIHSPLAMPTPQQLLSPSTTPAQSPHHHSHPHPILPQQPLQTQQMLASQLPPQVPPVNNAILPPPPDYNQAAAATARWPALNKPMDSATKTRVQEFTRYQMQYNLQQQQINSSQQNPQQQGQNQQLPPALNNGVPSPATPATVTCNSSIANVASLNETNTSGAGSNLPDTLMTLSDLDGLTQNDLDALLPSLSYDLDSTLSLEDKNELESLLQDAKDLNLDLIEENLSAVGVDIGDAAAATSLIEDDIVASSTSLQTGFEQNLSLGLVQQQNLINCGNINNTNNLQQQPQQQIFCQQQLSQTSQLPTSNQNHPILNPTYVQQQQDQQITQQQQQQQGFLINNSNGVSNYTRSTSAASNSSTASVTHQQKQLIINPLTGELEPMPSDDSETEAEQETQHLIRPPSVVLSSRTTPISSMVSSGSYIPAASEALPNILFSAEEDSNSCNTAVSKASEQNNGLVATSGAGSDTDRSRDSLISNKSASRSRKGGAKATQQQQLCNTLGASDLAPSAVHGTGNSSPLITSGATMSVATVVPTNRKSKINSLRDKLQQGVRERKKESTTAKPKRERNKAVGKTKTTSTSASSMSSNATPITTVASIAETSATNEKIKLRLKIEKSEPVSPAYKVDVTFVPSPKTSVSEAATSLASSTTATETDSITALQSTGSTTCLTMAGTSTTNLSTTSVLQSQFNTQMLASNAMHQHQNQQHSQQSQQMSLQTFNTFNLPSSVTVSATSTSTISSPNTATSNVSVTSNATDEPKVPPLHISLRGGKNSIVIKNSRKERKKSQATSIPGDADDDLKMKQLKRTYGTAGTTAKSVDLALKINSDIVDDISGPSDSKQSKLQQSGPTITQYNGTLESGVKANSFTESVNNSHFVSTASNAVVSKTTALLANKNGLTISALSTIHTSDMDCKMISGTNTTTVTSSVISAAALSTSTSISSTPITSLPQLFKQQQQQQQQQSSQILKTAALPSSITLSTVPCNSSGPNATGTSVGHRVIANLQLKNTLKTSSATIRPIGSGMSGVGGFSGGKPLTKNHKPPSYLAAVQQLQLQKQQQQQMAALAEKQTQQQMLAAAAQILPSATTLKRVEINTLTNKIESHEVIAPVSVATILTAVKLQSEAPDMSQNSSGIVAEKCDKNKQSMLATSVTTTVTTTTTSTATLGNVVSQEPIVVTKDLPIPKSDKNTAKAILVSSVLTTATTTTTSAIVVAKTTATIVTTTNATAITSAAATSTSISTSPVLRSSPPSSNGSSSHLGQGNNNNGSTGGGEDSGIESMDALSEKSPHQQASSSPAQLPQVITPPVLPVQVSDAGSCTTPKKSNTPSVSETQEATQKKLTVYTKKNTDQQSNSIADDEIEKALAKMEGLQEDNSTSLPASLPSAKTKSDDLKINGEHLPSKNNLNLAPIPNDGDNDDLIKNLTQVIDISDVKSERVIQTAKEKHGIAAVSIKEDLKEKPILKDVEEESFESETEKKKLKKDPAVLPIKEDITAIHKLSPSSLVEKIENAEVVKMEIIPDSIKEKQAQKICQKTVVINKEVKQETNKIHDVLPPISIDIPVSTESEAVRVRTRASSRLESPLEQTKVLNSPLSEQISSISVESNATPSTLNISKAVNSRALSPQSGTVQKDSHTSTANVNNNVPTSGINKDSKKRRPDSDPSDTFDSKRVRTATTVSSNSQVVSNAPKKLQPLELNLSNIVTSTSLSLPSPIGKSGTNSEVLKASVMAIDQIVESKIFKKIEESSDSDEPLIEVAEKVRNSKAIPSQINNSSSGNNESEPIVTPTETVPKSTNQKDVIESKDNTIATSNSNVNIKANTPSTVLEKTTRNSSRAHHQQNPKSVAISPLSTVTILSANINQGSQNTPNALTSSTTPPKSIKQPPSIASNVVQSNTSSATTTSTESSNNLNSSTAASSPTNSTTTTTANTTQIQQQQSQPQQNALTAVHATRGVTHSVTGANNNNNSSTVDEKIGTRRSVRASAAANKIIYSRTNAAHSADSKSSPATKGGHSNESVGEARRKTRSAVIGESLMTEGRRRRGSRDFK